MIRVVAGELLRLFDGQGIELKSADIPSLRKDLGMVQDEDSRRGPHTSRDSEEHNGS